MRIELHRLPLGTRPAGASHDMEEELGTGEGAGEWLQLGLLAEGVDARPPRPVSEEERLELGAAASTTEPTGNRVFSVSWMEDSNILL